MGSNYSRDTIFSPEQENLALQILGSIQTAQEAVLFLLEDEALDNAGLFQEVSAVLSNLLDMIRRSSLPYRETLELVKLPIACQSMKGSLTAICTLWQKDRERCKMKLRFELLPALENAYMEFYFWTYVYTHPEREKVYYEEEMPELASNPYINRAVETGQYKYDVSFMVLAYNKLEYTKMCVESLLRNIPDGLTYELILWDNGSSDSTQAYFESIQPQKLVESRINWSIGNLSHRIFEGKYCFSISNDVIMLPHSIENMLKCIQSNERIAWVVPSTPNVSNLQTIHAQYKDFEEMQMFAKQNNIVDPYRWEERVRLCDPVSLINSAAFFSKDGLNPSGYLVKNPNSFPDDRNSLLLRRKGYKMMLAKDAYCHHFGSVTLKSEIQQQNEQKFYLEGRREFYNAFGVDPWGTGFCYDAVFLNRVVGEEHGHVEVLGVNCGLGSNSLKIKEQIKEYCHNLDTCLSNITDDSSFILDLKGISDTAQTITTIKELKAFLNGQAYQYIVWETPFLLKYKFKTVLEVCMGALAPGGKLIIKLTGSSGFIGRHIQEAWRNKYDLYSPSHQKLDLLDLSSVERYLTDHYFDVVIHAANINNVRRQVNDHQILDGNLRMFCNLERCRSKYGKMYYFGSGAEYDMRHYVPQMPETYFGRHIPVDPYGFSKYMMSMLSNGNIYDLRLFGVFGHHEEWRRRFISNVIYQNLAGKSVQMRQNMYFDYIYIDDLLRILEWFLTHEPKRHHYNVCSGQKIDLYSLAQMVTQETGIAASIQVAQGGWKPEYTGDSRRLCEEFGALELTPMPTAIHEMVTYYRNNGFTDH